MPKNTGKRREALRRLLALASTRDIDVPESIASQIEDLLEEVLEDDDLLTEPLPLRADEGNENERIVVTGLGLVTPFGLGREPFWDGLRSGRSAIGPITLCDASSFPCRIAGEVPGF